MAKHGSYGALLFREEWKRKRKEILERDNNKCVICDSTQNIVVHHRQYVFIKERQSFKDPWDYDNSLLITLCRSCHQRGHTKFEVPIIYLK
jgi:5-methylcytosine-specific restriction endonuclease McrA